MANKTNETTSNRSNGPFVTQQVVIITSVTGGVAVLTCVAALVLVLALKLHTKLVYRLAAYQVLTSLLFAVANCLNLAVVDYHRDNATNAMFQFAGDSATHRVLCQIVAFARMYSAWVKLLAVVLVTCHLYCYVVRYNNLKRCEVVYVLVSVLVPIAICVVPFAMKSYGADGQWCWISGENSHQLKMSLWFGPAVFLLCIVTAAVAYMIVVLFRRACLESNDEFHNRMRQQHKNALLQLLPLLAYPVLFLIFLLPSFVSQVYGEEATYAAWLDPVNAFFSSLLSTSAGLTLIVHISSVWCATKRSVWRLHRDQRCSS